MTSELERLNDDLQRRWKGTGEEDSRLLAVNDFDDHAMATLDKHVKAECLRAKQLFLRKDYAGCLSALSQLVIHYPPERLNPYVLQNIAACYYQQEEWDAAMQANQQAQQLKDLDVGQRRRFRLLLIQERIREAQDMMEEHKRKAYWTGEVAALKAYRNYIELYDSHLYSHAMRELESLLRVIPCSAFEVLKVQLLSIEKLRDGVRYAEEKLTVYPHSAELHYWRCELHFRLASSIEGLQSVLQAFEAAEELCGKDLRFRLAAKNVSKQVTLLRTVEELKAKSQWQDVIVLCGTILNCCVHDGLTQFLLASRGMAFIHTAQWYAAHDDLCRAQHYAEDDANRAELYMLMALSEEGLQRWQEAALHIERSAQLFGDAPPATLKEVRRRIKAGQQLFAEKRQRREEAERMARATAEQRRADQEAKEQREEATYRAYEKQQRQQGGRPHFDHNTANSYQREEEEATSSKPRGKPKPSAEPPRRKPPSDGQAVYFRVLALNETSDRDEVKRAYRALAMRWHPDRWIGKSAEEMAAAEGKFKEVQNAYENIMSRLKG